MNRSGYGESHLIKCNQFVIILNIDIDAWYAKYPPVIYKDTSNKPYVKTSSRDCTLTLTSKIVHIPYLSTIFKILRMLICIETINCQIIFYCVWCLQETCICVQKICNKSSKLWGIMRRNTKAHTKDQLLGVSNNYHKYKVIFGQ